MWTTNFMLLVVSLMFLGAALAQKTCMDDVRDNLSTEPAPGKYSPIKDPMEDPTVQKILAEATANYIASINDTIQYHRTGKVEAYSEMEIDTKPYCVSFYLTATGCNNNDACQDNKKLYCVVSAMMLFPSRLFVNDPVCTKANNDEN